MAQKWDLKRVVKLMLGGSIVIATVGLTQSVIATWVPVQGAVLGVTLPGAIAAGVGYFVAEMATDSIKALN